MLKLNVIAGDITKSKADGIIVLKNTVLAGGNPASGGALELPNAICEEGPKWKDGRSGEVLALKNCYKEALETANRSNYTSVDILAVSAEEYSSQLFQIATSTLEVIKEFTDANDLPEDVTIVCESQVIANAYKQAYNFWFAVDKPSRLGSEDWEDWKK